MQIEKTREQLPVLTTENMVTLISDSGITRYRIESPLWLVYDKTETPYQEFPKGIYLEQFDEDLNVQGRGFCVSRACCDGLRSLLGV